MTRSIAQAARDALEGRDETLWHRIRESGSLIENIAFVHSNPTKPEIQEYVIKHIRMLSTAELALYDIEGETK